MDWNEVLDRAGEAFSKAAEGVNRGLLAVFGNSNERAVKKFRPRVAEINALEPRMMALSDEELKDQTRKFRARLADGETLDDILVEAFATCREAGRRYMKMRHYDVQLLGGMVLHSGRIAEMVTGEGKTLVATLPAYLNSLEGRGVHVVTVNDYLARRDAEWNSPLFTGLGLTVGAIQSSMDPHERQPQYACDITYATNNELGFDYLRDNMKPGRELQCQRELRYAIIDEVDSILIDEARTPLIISGPAIDDPTKYQKAHRVAAQLKRDLHFEVKEKEHTCHLTDDGVLEAEKLVGVESFYTAGNMEWPHLIDNALKSLYLYRRDKEYVVENGEVIIVDEHTGRKMEGRQWSDGLHQAVEAKEGVRIKEETQTLATITFQNFFKLYHKISGMTGTAMTEANEFYKIYQLDVVAIPTNKPLIRENYPDVIYCTAKEKWKAVVDEVKTVHRTGRPILVGTTTVEKSEFLSELFRRSGIKHEVLNAKFVEREAEIVAQAGRRNAVTIATNMAGRGTDIILGGNPETKAWAELKSQYATRLDVPPEVWSATIEPYEGPMKKEGRELVQTRPTLELAKLLDLKQPERYAEVVDAASRRQLEDPESLAKAKDLEVGPLTELIQLRRGATPGGLHIVGTERHDSRRIDNQLRGRSGRQGDPGSSRFFLSLEDDLMRIFAGDWVKGMLQRLGMQEGESIESRMVSRRIEGAQKKVEERYFETRKNLLEYDEIMDTQRKRVYRFRQAVLEGENCKKLVLEMIDHQVDAALETLLARDYGRASFAAWASNRLGAEFEARAFNRYEFNQAVEFAHDEAVRQAENQIEEKLAEDLSEDVDPREWNWESLAFWMDARWGVKVKGYDLKRIARDELPVHLASLARKSIEGVSLEAGSEFFEPDFGVRALLGWANQKFGLNLLPDDLPSEIRSDPTLLGKFLKEKARTFYDQKEAAFPVQCGMSRFMPEKSRQASGGARYDREGLIEWAQRRFGTSLDLDEYRELSRQQVIDRLVDANRAYMSRADDARAIDAKLATLKGSEDEALSAVEFDDVSAWANERFGRPLYRGHAPPTRATLRRELLALAEDKVRPELREAERALLLQFLDTGWKDHLYAMDHLRSGIGLVGYAQIDPKVEYKRKGKQLFEEMWQAFENRVTSMIFRVEEADPSFVSHLWNITNATHQSYSAPPEMSGAAEAGGIRQQQEAAIESSKGEAKTAPIRNRGKKVGRNDPCPCGSGKKYKNCCMAKDQRKTA